MTMNCPDPTRFDNLDQLPDGDPLKAHLESCPRCRALLKARLAFENQPEMSADEANRCQDAEKKLSGFLAEALDLNDDPAAEESEQEPDLPSWWARLWSFFAPLDWRYGAVTATAALALVLLLAVPEQINGPRVGNPSGLDNPMRGEEAENPGFSRPQTRVENNGDLVLQWTALEGAESYQILFWSESLQMIDTVSVGPETSSRFSEGLAKLPDQAAFFCVVALVKEREMQRSEMVPLTGLN